MVPFLPILDFVEALFGEDVFELLVRLGHYIFEACGAGPFCSFCKLLGYRLSGLDLFQVFTNEAYEKSVTLIQSSGSGHANPGSGSALLGSARPLGTSSMCTFRH